MLFGLTWRVWVNLMGFNLIWALSIFIGNDALLWVAVLLLLHFVFVAKRWVELPIVLVAALVGYSVDCVLTLVGVFKFEQAQGITPVWLLFLWLGFCSTLGHSLHFFSEKYCMASIAGAIAGSVTYFSAAHFGAVELPLSPVMSAAVLACVWALLFPALLWICHVLSKRLCV
jgi:hypothetical protein